MTKAVHESVVRVLIVEEIPAMRRLIRSTLEGMDLLVHECNDGREALAACAAEQPNWVLLDLNLSDTDALAATRQIRLAHPQTKVMIVSDDDNLLLREAARSAGACDYVLKENLLALRRRLYASAD